MSITTKNLPLSQDPLDKTSNYKFRLYLAEETDIDIEKWVKPVNATLSTIPFYEDKGFAYVDIRANTLVPNAANVGEVAPQGQLTIEASIDGLNEETLEWLYTNNGKRFAVVWENCVNGKKFIGGSPCSFLRLNYESLGKIDDWQGANIKFVGEPCPQPILFYAGEIVKPTEDGD